MGLVEWCVLVVLLVFAVRVQFLYDRWLCELLLGGLLALGVGDSRTKGMLFLAGNCSLEWTCDA